MGRMKNRCFTSCSNRELSLEEPLLISKLRLFFLFVDEEQRDHRGFVIGARCRTTTSPYSVSGGCGQAVRR